MHRQLDLARSGEALFKIRGKFLKYTILVGVVVAYFHGAIGPFDLVGANQEWFGMSLAVALTGALVHIVTSGYAALGTSGVTKDAPRGSRVETDRAALAGTQSALPRPHPQLYGHRHAVGQLGLWCTDVVGLDPGVRAYFAVRGKISSQRVWGCARR